MTQVTATPQVIAQVAADLFQVRGCDKTTLSAIAEGAGVSLGQLEDSFHSKEEIILHHYHLLAEETLTGVKTLPHESIAKRYYELLEGKLSQLAPHLDAVSLLFATAMRPQSAITAADIAPGTSDPMLAAFRVVVQGAADAPPGEVDTENLALMLYSFHFLVILFWLYDRTAEKRATHLLTAFLRDLFKMLRPLMIMPLFGKALPALSKILMLVFGGAKFTD